jgi:endonuclease I
MRTNSLRALAALSVLFSAVSANAQVLITAGAPASENFDSLASTGSTNTTLPTGWFLSEPGSNGQYVASNGAGAGLSGSVYSFGTTGSGERALGSIASGSTAPTIGAQLRNDTGAPLTALRVAFTMEQWRLGTPGAADQLTFAYSSDATSLTSGTWIPVSQLDAVAVITAGTAETALDGNAAANRTAVTFDIEGLSIAPNATLWIRWSDFNDLNVDDGIAIDDVSLGVTEDTAPTVQSSSPANGDIDVAIATEIELVFSEAVTVDEAGLELSCDALPQSAQLGGSGTSYTLLPDDELPYGADCLLSIDADAVLDIDGTTLDPMESDFQLAFATVADLAPVLASSTPSNGSTTFPANGSLQLGFSEAVTVGPNWFVISCSVSGARDTGNTAASGGPVNFTLNPSTDFAQGETCTLQLDAAQISDQDGVADALANNTPITFTPAAAQVNQPPVVLSTTPMQGADDFPPFGDLVVLFSEPVTLQSNAFALSCTASTGIVLSYPSSGTSFTIDTGTALVASDSCTFSIDRTRVQDAEGANPVANTTVNFTVSASSVGGYYAQVNTSSPDQLRCSLHETIKGHTLFPYGWEQLEDAEQAPAGVCPSSNYILDIYRNRCYQKVTARSNPVGPNNYNREHVWPRSLGFNNTSLAAHNDLHMLHLSASDWNGSRGNKPFANCPSGCTALETDANNGDGGGPDRGDFNWVQSPDGNAGSFEVWDRWKGNMARAIFYMAVRYEGIASEDAHDGNIPDLELTNNRSQIQILSNTVATAYMGLLDDLLLWHAQDPVDARELERNEVVFGYQGNRNPFVDHPEWATLALFQSSQPPTCVLGSGGNTAPVAVDDLYAATEDALLTVAALDGVLDNDTDADSDTLTALLVAQAANGTVALASSGGFTYQPNANFCGQDQFTYRASDGQAQSPVAIARINVACVNDPPAANDDTVVVGEDSGATVVNVLANDSIAPDTGETLAVTAVTQGSVGSVTLVSGVVRYTPNANASGSDSFTYMISDGNGGTDTASVGVTITPANDPPQANDDTLAIDEDAGATVVNVLANDSFAPDAGETLTVIAVTQGSLGSVSLVGGVVSYTPNSNANGSDAFTYTISDGNGGTDTATVAVTIAALNDAPTAVGTLPAQSAQEGVAIVGFSIADGFADVDAGDDLDYQQTGLPAGLVLDAETGAISGTPAAGSATSSPYTVVITASDGEASVQQSFQYTVTPAAPVEPHIFGDGFED